MRMLVAVLVLAGCAWGQTSASIAVCADKNNRNVGCDSPSALYCAGDGCDHHLLGMALGRAGPMDVPAATVKDHYAQEPEWWECTGAIEKLDGELYCVHEVKSEPMDVPAVESDSERIVLCSSSDTAGCSLQGFGGDAVGLARAEKVKHYSCSDKRRVLLTSEDGQKHCVLFPQQ
jgi:hypothetical protein